jgi:tripartite-type tricarboxylate transporter receptor subunit TctC
MKIARVVRFSTVAIAAWLSCAILPQSAMAQTWPARPIKLMVTFGPGSGTDIIARVIAEGLSEHLKVPVVVENREGAGGVVGVKAAMAQPADGYTLVAVANTFLIAPQLYKAMPYDPTRDFTPLARVASMPMALVVGAQSPFKTMKDLIDHIRANPGKTSFATSGKGAQSHLEIAYVMQQLGLSSVDIPYKNTGGAITDTMGGLVTFYMTVLPAVTPNLNAGKLRALAVGAPARLPGLPDIPTYVEGTGIADYVPTAWFGYAVLNGTPADIVAKLNEGIVAATNVPKVREKIQGVGASISVAQSRELAAQMRVEADRWSNLVNALGMRTD